MRENRRVVLSILGAGLGPRLDLDNLGLKRSYSGIKAMVAVSHP